MKKSITLLVLFVVPFLSHASGANLFKLTMDVGSSIYTVDVNQANENKGKHSDSPGGAELSISCTSSCSDTKKYSEMTINSPIYIMRSSDVSDRVITVWTTGSSYQVVVFKVGDRIKKVLSEGSRSAPEISFSKDGSEQLRLCVENGCKTYRWAGSTYLVVN